MNFEAFLEFGKTYEVELEKHTPSKGTWIVEGYGSTSDLDAQNHVVSQDAINMGAECLMKYNTVLFNHDPDRPIGHVEKSEAQAGKLFIKVAISKSEPKIWQQIQDGTLSKFSIRGYVTDSEIRQDELTKAEYLVIKGMELHEVSLVSVPANVNARSISYYIEKAIHDEKEKKTAITVKIDGAEFIRELEATLQKDKPIKVEPSGGTVIEILKLEYEKLNEQDRENFRNLIKGGQEIVEEVKKEDVVVEEVKVEEKVVVVEEVKKEQVTLDVSALKDVISQLQALAKTVTSQSETVKTQAEAVEKTVAGMNTVKDEIAKMFGDLNTLVKDIPLRNGQAPAADKVEERKDKTDEDFTKSDSYKNADPRFKLTEVLKRASGELK